MVKKTHTSVEMTDEEALENQFSRPWQFNPEAGSYRDEDGFTFSATSDKDDPHITRQALQEYCWLKFNQNPQVNTSVRGTVGRITGLGFEVTSDIPQIQDVIDEIELDPRNRLWDVWRQYVGRSIIEGELFLTATCHDDGFVEIDFVDPAVVDGENDHGIIYHPNKAQMPLFYCINEDGSGHKEQIPSINIARYPELIQVAETTQYFRKNQQSNNKSRKKAFKQFGGYYRFMLHWNKGFVTKRNISHLRTVMEWLSYWEMLKKYEIDFKKSAGAYVWAVEFQDTKSWIQWLKLSDADRAKTGIAAKKTPGGTMVLGPNMKLTAINPNLTKISDQDTDIFQMITSGLNEPEDVTTGKSSGTFASISASRGPMSDRISDEVSYFARWYRYDFWGSIFFLKAMVSDFPEYFKTKEAIGFEKAKEGSEEDPKPIFRNVKKKPERLIEISFPTSEVNDYEGTAKGLMGVKHGSLDMALGIPKQVIAGKMGFGNYNKLRLIHATEQERYPALVDYLDQESVQEKQESEPKVAIKKKVDSKNGQ